MSLSHIASGKVREIYALDDDRLLFVATDRVSAYDVVMTEPIPDKGRVLTQLSAYFFDMIDVPNHLVSTSVDELSIAELPDLSGRAMIVRRAEMVPIECVVRGYLFGSAWREYAGGGGPTTEHLPSGLAQGSRLSAPIFTPATKAASGHDENLTEGQARALVGDDTYDQLAATSIEIFHTASEHVERQGLVLADTKLEFGWIDGVLTVCDELLTPDSSRYWPIDAYAPPNVMPGFDKQYLRDWLDSTGWDHSPPPPALPADVIRNTRLRYLQAFRTITGQELQV